MRPKPHDDTRPRRTSAALTDGAFQGLPLQLLMPRRSSSAAIARNLKPASSFSTGSRSGQAPSGGRGLLDRNQMDTPLLLNHIGMATAPTLYPDRLTPFASFEFVGLVADVPMTIVARRSFPAKDAEGVDCLYRRARDRRSRTRMPGRGRHRISAAFCFRPRREGNRLPVPYKGTGPCND